MTQLTMVQVSYQKHRNGPPILSVDYVQATDNAHAWEQVKPLYETNIVLDVYVTSNPNHFEARVNPQIMGSTDSLRH